MRNGISLHNQACAKCVFGSAVSNIDLKELTWLTNSKLKVKLFIYVGKHSPQSESKNKS